MINPKEMRWNKALPEGLADVFAALPSKAAPKAEAKPIKRLLALAAAIGVDGLITDANDQVHARLYGALDGQRAQHKDAVEAGVEDILTADIARITASKVTLTSTETTHQVAADALTVDDAFRLATRSLGAAIANGYVKNLATNNQPAGEDFDVHDAKAQVAALVRIDGVVQQVEAEANRLAADWFSALHARIKGLSEERRGVYTELKQQGREPQQFDLVVPTSRLEPSFEEDAAGNQVPVATRPKHLLSDEQGDFPVGKLGVGLELETLDIELARDETVAWYRNPSNATSDAVQVPWHDGQRWRSMQPDFVVFSTKADGSLVASIVDPHSHYLGDALGKLKGMAAFAEEFSGDFLRIESITFDKDGSISPDFKGAHCMLDMTEPTVRQAVQDASSATEAYRSAGQLYK